MRTQCLNPINQAEVYLKLLSLKLKLKAFTAYYMFNVGILAISVLIFESIFYSCTFCTILLL